VRVPFIFVLSFFASIGIKLVWKEFDDELDIFCRWRGAEYLES
jgi:hypothetical protein